MKVVFFDIDGTLLNTGKAGSDAFRETWQALFAGKESGLDSLVFAGATDSNLVDHLMRRNGMKPCVKTRERFFRTYEIRLEQRLASAPSSPLPGVDDLIKELQTEIVPKPALGLITGNTQRAARLKLRRVGLADHFEWGAFGCERSDRDDLARLAQSRARERIGPRLNPAEILIVGDTLRDVQCAKAIGARCLAVATGSTTREKLAQAGADWALDSLKDLAVREIFQ